MQNLGRHLRFLVYSSYVFLTLCQIEFFSTVVISFLLPSNTENVPSRFLLYLILHLSTIPFLFSLLLPTHRLFSYQVIYL